MYSLTILCINNIANPDWEVVQSAQETLPDSDTIHKVDTASAVYVSREFMKATEQNENVITVPKTFPLSGPPKEGELAEKEVFEKLKEAAKKILKKQTRGNCISKRLIIGKVSMFVFTFKLL